MALLLSSHFLELKSQHENAHEGQHDVYLLGNLVDIQNYTSFLDGLKEEFDKNENGFTLIVNGDLVDDRLNDLSNTQRQLDNIFSLIDLFSIYEKGKLILLSGDRDWNNNGLNGYKWVKALEKEVKDYLKTNKATNVKWLINKSCPGPFDLELDVHVLLIGLNSQWWNHTYDKPRASDAICKYITPQDIKEEFEDLLDENRNKNILVVTHHPIKSLGNYGGRFSLLENLAPFPLIGSFKTAFHANIGGPKDLSNEQIEPFHDLMNTSLFLQDNLIFASSHEKNQQVMKINENYLINSGAIENATFAASDHTSVFSEKVNGMMRISYLMDGGVYSTFLEFDSNKSSFSKDFRKTLFTSACNLDTPQEEIHENLTYIPCNLGLSMLPDERDQLNGISSVAAGPQYWKNGFYQLWMGDHYRKEWSTPVKVNYLNIDTTFDGLSVLKRGGGRQTLSLKFQAENGARFTFRSVDKDPSKALNYKLRTSIVSKVFRDQTSTQHPYGAMVVADLIDHLDILHATPRLYRLPNINALGPFQKRYGGMLGMLEENPGKLDNKGQYFAQADDILKSNKLFRKLFEEKSNKVDEHEFIKARIFDILIGDWSKHEDNWKWAAYKKEDNTIYRPIPRDRDHVFAKWDGILPSIADLPFGAPNTEGFDHKIKGFKSLVFQARYLDRFLTTEAEKATYLEVAKLIQQEISDQDIEDAVRQMPASSFAISGNEIISKLKQRKQDLQKYALQYYEWLNEEVEVIGSTEEDYFDISIQADASVKVEIYNETKRKKGDQRYYSRTFYPGETKEIRLYGLGDKDIFNIQGGQTKLKIRLIGGQGADSYLVEHKQTSILVYDRDREDTQGITNMKVVDHWDEEIYEYDRHQLGFSNWYPNVLVGYNNFNGFTLGLGNTWVNRRWGKRDFASKHHVNVRGSTKGDWGIKYAGQWHHVINKTDLTGDISLANPEYFNSYYGLGNGTTINPELDNNEFYVVNFNRYGAYIGILKEFWKKSKVTLQSGFEINSNKRIEETILTIAETPVLGANETLKMIPLLFNVEVDLRDHPTLPYSGIRAIVSNRNYWITDRDMQYYGLLEASLDYFLSTHNKKPFTLGLKVSGTKGIGEVPFYHQPLLGSDTGLRGYTNQRFAGRSKFLFNSELRWEFANSEKSSIPVRMGVLAFYDMGKVITENDHLADIPGFHKGYGFGIFVVPFSRSVSFSLTFAFSEENSFFPGFTFGTALR